MGDNHYDSDWSGCSDSSDSSVLPPQESESLYSGDSLSSTTPSFAATASIADSVQSPASDSADLYKRPEAVGALLERIDRLIEDNLATGAHWTAAQEQLGPLFQEKRRLLALQQWSVSRNVEYWNDGREKMWAGFCDESREFWIQRAGVVGDREGRDGAASTSTNEGVMGATAPPTTTTQPPTERSNNAADNVEHTASKEEQQIGEAIASLEAEYKTAQREKFIKDLRSQLLNYRLTDAIVRKHRNIIIRKVHAELKREVDAATTPASAPAPATPSASPPPPTLFADQELSSFVTRRVAMARNDAHARGINTIGSGAILALLLITVGFFLAEFNFGIYSAGTPRTVLEDFRLVLVTVVMGMFLTLWMW
jgi:hypothetical protein